MKSTVYKRSGAEGKGVGDEPDTETLVVMRPLTSGLIEDIIALIRLREISANAKLVYLYCWAAANHGEERVSQRATARLLNMPHETYRRAREELAAAQLLTPIRTGQGRWSVPRQRTLVNDIRDPTQNRSLDEVTQNRPVAQNRSLRRVLHRGAAPRQNSLKESKNNNRTTKTIHKNGHTSSGLTNEEKLFHPENGPREFDRSELDDVFDEPPPKVPDRAATGRFKLKPPPGPDTERCSPRVSGRKLNGVPVFAYAALQNLCFGAKSERQAKALSKDARGRIGSVLQRLLKSGADFNRIWEVVQWWRTWAKYMPTPEKFQEFWWRAIEEIDKFTESVRDEAEASGERPDDVQIQETAIRRAIELGNEYYRGWTPEQIHSEAVRRARDYVQS